MRVVGRSGRTRAALVLSLLSVGVAVIATPPAQTATAGATVSVVLDEWKLVPSRTAVPAGRVTFAVRNEGSLAHELVVLRSDRRAGKLPVKGGKAVEAGRRGRISKIPAGASRRLTLTLRPGKYVLLCNLLGHYQAGQFAALRAR